MLTLTLPLPGSSSAPSHSVPATLADLWQSGFRYKVTRPINVLFMGIDEVPGAADNSSEIFTGRTDTLLLVHIDPDSQSANVLSIPRDTRVQIPEYGTDKINQANVEGGPELVAQTIRHSLGTVPVDRYVRVSTGAFRELVDLVGGVEVFVPKRMVYDDNSQNLHIDLYPGWQTLNGDQAEQFARFRKDAYGDIGRVQRQQMLLKALRERLTSPAVIPKLPQVLQIMQRYVDTNLTPEEMLALANFALGMQTNDLKMVMLPGRFSSTSEYTASYWLADWDAGTRIMQDFFGTDTDSVAVLTDSSSNSVSNLRIAIQNASGSPHVASEVAQYLQEQGFHNVYLMTDWPGIERQSHVIAQRGDLASAGIVQSVLGVGRVAADSTGDLQSDITVRVGEDWQEHLSDLSPETATAE